LEDRSGMAKVSGRGSELQDSQVERSTPLSLGRGPQIARQQNYFAAAWLLESALGPKHQSCAVEMDWDGLGKKVLSRRKAHFVGAKPLKGKDIRPLPGTVGPRLVLIHVVGSVG
jgi:hypothetical protein